MATKTYLLTIDESELTDELRALLERKGAYLQEEPIEELHLPPDVERQLLEDMDAAERGDFSGFKSWEQVKAELEAWKAKRQENG